MKELKRLKRKKLFSCLIVCIGSTTTLDVLYVDPSNRDQADMILLPNDIIEF